MKNFICLLAVMAGMASACFAASGDCEENAVSLSISASGVYRDIRLVAEHDPEAEKGEEAYDQTSGVYYFKATLKRGYAYTVWTEGVQQGSETNETVQVSVYPADPDEDSEKEGPSAEFTEIDEPDANQRYVLYADEWYIDDEDPSMSDPASWTYIIEIRGEVGDTLRLCGQQGVVIPQGREMNPQTIYPATGGSTISRTLQVDDEYYLRARLMAGRLYWFGTAGGSADNLLSIDIERETAADEDENEPAADLLLYIDPVYSADPFNDGFYVIPQETAYYSICVSGGPPPDEESGVTTNASSGAAFKLSHRLFAEASLADHTVVPLEAANNYTATCVPGWLDTPERLAAGIYDDIIDETLYSIPVTAGQRFVAETTGAATNLLLRVYDAKGELVVENRGNGLGFDVRAGFTAKTSGVYYVGVCQDLSDPFSEEPVRQSVQLSVKAVSSGEGGPDSWDTADDEPAGATALSPIPGTPGARPGTVDAAGQGPHRLDRADWADVFCVAARKGITYVFETTYQNSDVKNTLRAEVFTLSGTTERSVESEGDINAGAPIPLSFTATANATYYLRLSVAEGVSLDSPTYRIHALAYSADGAPLGTLTVNTLGTTDGTFSLGSETVKYPGGSSVLVSGAQTVKFGAVKGFSTPAAQQVDVVAGTTPTVIDVYYSDTFDPKDDVDKTATAWTLKATETTMARTLWPTDLADNFALTGTDGYYYELELRDVTGDAVFSITNALAGTIVENVTKVHQLTLPKSAAKYILTVKHGTEAKAGGSYTLAGSFANVGAIKLAKTALSAKENAPSIVLTVNRTAKAGVVRVKYTTVDGTAKAGEDYVAQAGVLEWADGDNKAKTITLKTIPDLVATYDGNKTFAVTLAPIAAGELGENEYPATFVGGDTCTITLTEVSKAGTTAATTYAAKQPKVATVTTEKVPLESGTFYGVLQAAAGSLTNGLPQLASVTFTASAVAPEKAALSAKVMLAGKAYTFKATGWDVVKEKTCVKTFELVQKVNNVVYTNRLCVGVSRGRTDGDGDWQKGYGEVELYMNVPDANNKGVQTNIGYEGALFRQNVKVQDYLTAVTNFTGYYTLALVPQGVTAADGVPAGNGYLTVTIDNKGTAKVAGVLADGTTKVSCSVTACGLMVDPSSANGYSLAVPVYFVKKPCCFGGLLYFKAQAETDLPSGATMQVVAVPDALVWNNDNAALTYAGQDGYQLKVVPCGGWYDQIFNLQTYYLNSACAVGTADFTEFPKEMLGAGYDFVTEVSPNGFALDLEGDKIAYAKKVLVKDGRLVDFAQSANVCNVVVKFARATGVYSGSCSLWSADAAGAQKELTGLKHAGVVVLSRTAESPLGAEILGAGTVTSKVKLVEGGKTRTWSYSLPFNIVLSTNEKED